MKSLDITSYLAPKFPYNQFLKAYECAMTNQRFYEQVDSLDKLNFHTIHTISRSFSFYTARFRHYRGTVRVLCYFLVGYSNLDVVPFLEKVSTFWKDRSIDIFKDDVSVPGLTMKVLVCLNIISGNSRSRKVNCRCWQICRKVEGPDNKVHQIMWDDITI